MKSSFSSLIKKYALPVVYLTAAAVLGFWGLYQYAPYDYFPVHDIKTMVYTGIFMLLTVLIACIQKPLISFLLAGSAAITAFIIAQSILCFLSPWLLLLVFFFCTKQKCIQNAVIMVLSALFLIFPIITWCQNIRYFSDYPDAYRFSTLTFYDWFYRIAAVLFTLYYIFAFMKSFSFTKKSKNNPTPLGESYSTFYLFCIVISIGSCIYLFPLVASYGAAVYCMEQLAFLLCLYYSKDAVLVGSIKPPNR